MLIGNDLIDIRTREARGKASDGRFIARVFTQGEAACIESSSDPDHTLWILWAGKEAAYKIAKKLQPATIFAHAAYEVTPAAHEPARDRQPTERFRGHVHIRGMQGLEGISFPVEWEVTASFVHCVAIESAADAPHVWSKVASHEELERASYPYEPSEREMVSVRSAESIAVRRLARELARESGLGDVEIVRERSGATFGPPRLFPAGGTAPLAGWDLSLSHDGYFAAAALSGVVRRLA